MTMNFKIRQHVVYQKIVLVAVALGMVSMAGCGSHNEVSGSEISLNVLSGEILIPANAKTVRLRRGSYAFTLQKEKNLSSARYYVVDVYKLSKPHEPDPYEAYCAQFSVVPAGDKRALSALAKLGAQDSRGMPVESMAEANKIMQDMQHLNKAQFSVVVLPRDNTVKRSAQRIKEGDMIVVSGIQLKHVKTVKDDVGQQACQGALMTKVLYVTDLAIE